MKNFWTKTRLLKRCIRDSDLKMLHAYLKAIQTMYLKAIQTIYGGILKEILEEQIL